MSNERRSLIVVFKGGPNHGVVLGGEDAAIAIFHKESERLKVGDAMQTTPAWYGRALSTLGHERIAEALKRIGIQEFRMAKYQIESIEDDILVYNYLGDA